MPSQFTKNGVLSCGRPRQKSKRCLINTSISIDSIVFDVKQTFKVHAIVRHTRFDKQEGYPVTEILALLIVFPLVLVSSVNSFFHSELPEITTMKKDALYRLKNNEGVPWRTILFGIAKRFQKIVNPDKIVAANSAFILDDHRPPGRAAPRKRLLWVRPCDRENAVGV